MEKKYKYLFGPVASRRLGTSLGVDIVPLKTCTQNCVYCQLGISSQQTIERKEYVPIDDVLSELKQRIDDGLDADYITLSGSGEPTLNSGLGRLIDGIKELTETKVAVITNGTLLSDPQVRRDCSRADLVMPSLDAGDAATFAKINCPHADLNFNSFVEGLCKFRNEYSAQIWLEVFFIDGINTDDTSVDQIKAIVERIAPDRVQLNTAVRPGADGTVGMVSADKLTQIAKKLGQKAEIIANFSKLISKTPMSDTKSQILAILERRPCDITGICDGLGIESQQVQENLNYLEQAGLVEKILKNNAEFFIKK
ncbi:MAG: radical SAM protein [Planctomycetes bacterium]|nr:radical SAM protein [Planctomycetota bacterium]